MDISPVRLIGDAQGQATHGMAHLQMDRTGPPFIVFIPQKDAARHDVRAKVAPGPRMRSDQMNSYALRPFALADDRDGRIEYTEDALGLLKSL